MPGRSAVSAALLASVLLGGCASTRAGGASAIPTSGPRETRFPLFAGRAERPVWLQPSEVNAKGQPIVKGPTRANMDVVSLPYTDLPLMDVEPCETGCEKFQIPVTRVDGRGTTAPGPGGVRQMETSRTLPSPDGMNRAVEWWILEQDPARATLRVTHVVGVFDPGPRTPIRYTLGRVEAAPIEEGVLYAFRTCEEGCDRLVGDPLRVERVTMIGPSSSWASSSDEPLQPTREDDFTRVTAQVRPGSAESVTLNYDTYDAAEFTQRTLDPTLAGGVSTVMLDVVWVEGELPELTFHRGFFVDAREEPELRISR